MEAKIRCFSVIFLAFFIYRRLSMFLQLDETLEKIQLEKIFRTMKLFLSVCLVALVAGIVSADESKGPKVTDKVGAHT